MKSSIRSFADRLPMRKRAALTSCIGVALSALLVTIGTNMAFGQSPSTGIDAVTILLKSSSAMGCSLVGNDTTIDVKGTLRLGGGMTVMPLTIQSQGNHRWRSELDTSKERKVTVVNDGKGQIQHADGRVNSLADHNTSHQRPMHIPCLTNLALPASAIDTNYIRMETTGVDSFDVIEILPSGRPHRKEGVDLMKTTVWISRNTGYLIRMQYTNSAENNSNDTETVEIDYFDYRVIDGLAVPFHQVTHAGNTLLDLRFDSVQLNSPAADFKLR